MNVVIWIIAGAILGVAAHALTRNRNRAGIALNIATGIAGVVAGGWLLGVLTRTPAFIPGEFSPASFLVSLMAATVLLTALQMFRGRRSGETATRLDDNASAAFAIAGHAPTPKMRELT